jgi:hypothetical protein
MVWLSGLVPSYRQAEAVFERIGHRHIPRVSLWRRTHAHGERLKAYVEHQQEHVAPERIVLGDPRKDHHQVKGITMDGGMVNIRDEGWKEFKVGAVCDIVAHNIPDPETGEPMAIPGAVNIGYTAVLGDVQQFAPALWKLAVDHQVPCAARSGVIGDGAVWIWNLAADYFPDSIQIVDWFHADEHLALAAHALYPDDLDRAAAWRHHMHEPLFLGRAASIARTLEQAGLDDHALYFHTHQRRMQYHEFREEGFPIGSGPVESACKQYKSRLTGPGMRWSRTGAEQMLVIRSAMLSDTFDALWAIAA